jgi:hypothetical protein
VVVVGSILVALQYGNAVDHLRKAGLPLDRADRAALDSVVVHGSTGRRELHEVPSKLAGAVRQAAHEGLTYAFSNSMRVIAIVAAVAGVIALLLFRAKTQPEPALTADDQGPPAERPTLGSLPPGGDRDEVADHSSGPYHLQR